MRSAILRGASGAAENLRGEDTIILLFQMLGTGVAVGVLSAALGLGGGVLMVPAFLEVIPSMDPHTAKGTSLLVISFVAVANIYRLNRGVHDKQWWLAAACAGGSVFGGVLGVFVTWLMQGNTVLWIFIVFVTASALRTFFIQPPSSEEKERPTRYGLAAAIGFATGITAGMTGIGGGAVLVPLALMAHIVSNNRVVALSNAVMVPTCAVGALLHAFGRSNPELSGTWGQLDVTIVPLVFIGAQLGAAFGWRMNEKLTISTRKVVMGILLLGIAVRLAFRAAAM